MKNSYIIILGLLFFLASGCSGLRNYKATPKNEIEKMLEKLQKAFHNDPKLADTYDKISYLDVDQFKTEHAAWADIQEYYYKNDAALRYFLKYRQCVLKEFLEKALDSSDATQYFQNQEDKNYFANNRIDYEKGQTDFSIQGKFNGRSRTTQSFYFKSWEREFRGYYVFNNMGSTSTTSDIDLNVDFEERKDEEKTTLTHYYKIKAIHSFITIFNQKFETYFGKSSAELLDVNLYPQVLNKERVKQYIEFRGFENGQPSQVQKDQYQAYVLAARFLLGSILKDESYNTLKEESKNKRKKNKILKGEFEKKFDDSLQIEYTEGRKNPYFTECLKYALNDESINLNGEAYPKLSREKFEVNRNKKMSKQMHDSQFLVDRPFESICKLMGTDYYALEAYVSLEDIIYITSLQMKGSKSSDDPLLEQYINKAVGYMGEESHINSMFQNFAYGVIALFHHKKDGKEKIAKYMSRMYDRLPKIKKDLCWKNTFDLLFEKNKNLKTILREGNNDLATLNKLRNEFKRIPKDSLIDTFIKMSFNCATQALQGKNQK